MSVSDYSREIDGFNAFIEKVELVVIPMIRRKYTWYKPNVLVKSRIDRVLVSKEWVEVWLHCKQFFFSRSVFDHCAIVIKDEYVDWGSKPFRSLDVWQSDNRFKVFLKERWPSYEVQGGGIYIFKEKLKKLKADLKVWNKTIFGDVNQAGEGLQKRNRELDGRDDEFDLNELEREERKTLVVEFNKNLFKQEAIVKQKARQKWLKQGDLNTKFFHSSVKWRKAKNELHGVLENGRWCENKDEVKDKVREFFEARFVGNEDLSVKLDNVKFNSISKEDNQMLVEAFLEEEIKDAVWSCESSKSPGPDDFNLGFIKFCWEFIKANIMAAVKDFEACNKWPRGSNASFLCLIPKNENP
ncbi:uncharacterized protein [Phaseolus vulgaris]|uniref:uncharacterized protein n=1 Tax=Phaseolus vulgaris TaxID=3885 RepID=UPI0035C983AD